MFKRNTASHFLSIAITLIGISEKFTSGKIRQVNNLQINYNIPKKNVNRFSEISFKKT